MTQLKKKLVSTYANTCVTREKKTPKLKDGPDEATLKKKKKRTKDRETSQYSYHLHNLCIVISDYLVHCIFHSCESMKSYSAIQLQLEK